MTWAMQTRPRTPTEKLILVALADHHNRSTGRCDPSINRLADEALCSPRQAMRCIESLTNQGFIRPVKVVGRRSSYVLNLSQTSDTSVTRDTDVTSDTHVTTTSDTHVTTTSDTHVTTTSDTHVTGPVTPMSPEPGTNQEDKPGMEKISESDDPLLRPVEKPKGRPGCPQEEILAMYHELLPELRRHKVWTGKRQAQLRARWREDTKRQSLDYWRRFFGYVRESDFLMGRSNPRKPGDTPFMADLEFLTRAEIFARVIEGKYHRGQHG